MRSEPAFVYYFIYTPDFYGPQCENLVSIPKYLKKNKLQNYATLSGKLAYAHDVITIYDDATATKNK